MPETMENYVPQIVSKPAANKTGRRIWLVLFLFSAFWLGLIISVPLLKQAGFVETSAGLYYAFSFICHQIPERSFHLHEDKLAVCARCAGVYAGIFLGFLFYPLFRRVGNVEPMPRVWLILACVPLAVDWALTFFGIWENTHATRFLTGALLGAACAVYILPALVEISLRILSRREKQKLSPSNL